MFAELFCIVAMLGVHFVQCCLGVLLSSFGNLLLGSEGEALGRRDPQLGVVQMRTALSRDRSVEMAFKAMGRPFSF